LNALDELVKWAKEREMPPGEWTAPLQDLLMGKDMFSMCMKQFLFPVAVFDRRGVIKIANDKLLEGTGLTDDDIKAGKANINGIDDFDFSESVKLALRGETHAVCGWKNPMEQIYRDNPEQPPDYPRAILFTLFSDTEPTRGVVVFLPFEYRPENA